MKFLRIQDELEYSLKRFELKREIENLLINRGYVNVEPSILEDYEEFTSQNKRIDKDSTVKVLNENGRISILRPDITTNIIHNIIPRWEENLKLKLFYYSKIFINSNYKTKEIRQMGAEYLGEKGIKADEEIIELALYVLKSYRDNFLFEIGSTTFLKGLLSEFYFEPEEYKKVMGFLITKNEYELRKYILKFDKNEATETLLNIFNLQGTYDEIMDNLSNRYLNDQMKNGLEIIKKINTFITQKGLNGYVEYDLSMVFQLGYYSGLIFKGILPDSNREIIKGGRYDSYTEEFGEKIPAIGFSIEIDELIKVLYKKGEI